MPPRNQLGVDFSVQPPVAHRIPAVPQHSPHIDFRYPPAPERRLPGGPSQDPYNRLAGSSSTLPMESDHRSSLVPSSSVRSDASPAAETSTSPRDSRKEISSVVIACRQWYVKSPLFINPFNAILNRFSSILPLVAVAKFDATQQDPCATTASEDRIHASMTLCQSGGGLISVRVRVNDHVKSGRQMVLSLHPRNADALPIQPRDQPSNANFPRPRSRRISSTSPGVFLPQRSAIRIVIPTSKIITTHTPVVNCRPHIQTSGCRQIKTTTRCEGPDRRAPRPLSQRLFISMTCPRPIVGHHRICTIKVPIQNRPIRANST